MKKTTDNVFDGRPIERATAGVRDQQEMGDQMTHLSAEADLIRQK